jgi:hypothetical protein
VLDIPPPWSFWAATREEWLSTDDDAARRRRLAARVWSVILVLFSFSE